MKKGGDLSPPLLAPVFIVLTSHHVHLRVGNISPLIHTIVAPPGAGLYPWSAVTCCVSTRSISPPVGSFGG